eukprot:GHVU01187974.1.p1 GENE.GHVU01187974.1~~GHVU01187974.1.p1  ORF type:complete len:476 (+),score=61.50 GHVU01187974.1:104-1531(+)
MAAGTYADLAICVIVRLIAISPCGSRHQLTRLFRMFPPGGGQRNVWSAETMSSMAFRSYGVGAALTAIPAGFAADRGWGTALSTSSVITLALSWMSVVLNMPFSPIITGLSGGASNVFMMFVIIRAFLGKVEFPCFFAAVLWSINSQGSNFVPALFEGSYQGTIDMVNLSGVALLAVVLGLLIRLSSRATPPHSMARKGGLKTQHSMGLKTQQSMKLLEKQRTADFSSTTLCAEPTKLDWNDYFLEMVAVASFATIEDIFTTNMLKCIDAFRYMEVVAALNDGYDLYCSTAFIHAGAWGALLDAYGLSVEPYVFGGMTVIAFVACTALQIGSEGSVLAAICLFPIFSSFVYGRSLCISLHTDPQSIGRTFGHLLFTAGIASTIITAVADVFLAVRAVQEYYTALIMLGVAGSVAISKLHRMNRVNTDENISEGGPSSEATEAKLVGDRASSVGPPTGRLGAATDSPSDSSGYLAG